MKTWRHDVVPRIGQFEKHSFIADFDHNSVVVDLGANHGDFATHMIAAYGCRVYGVEPVPFLAAQMPTHERFHLREAAVGPEDGSVMLSINPGQCASVGFARADAELVEVTSVTLETLFEDWGLGLVDLLKVDIEGSELAVFEKASDEVLRRCRQITVEFHDFLDPALAPGVQRSIERLESLGFERINFSLDNTDVLFTQTGLGSSKPYVLARFKYMRGLRRTVRSRLKQKLVLS